jgi:hypothetical protein
MTGSAKEVLHFKHCSHKTDRARCVLFHLQIIGGDFACQGNVSECLPVAQARAASLNTRFLTTPSANDILHSRPFHEAYLLRSQRDDTHCA